MNAKKVLVLGTNDYSTNELVTQLADKHKSKNNGLLHSTESSISVDGFYHTTLVDLSFGEILTLSKSFNLVILLDQPKEQWSHWKILLSTYKLMCEIEKNGITDTSFRKNQNIKSFEFYENFVKDNKSFCIFPWITDHEKNGDMYLCARSNEPVKKKKSLISWKNDPEYNKIRNKMLSGEKIPEQCSTCYYYEDHGIESYRQFETKEWIAKLDIKNLEDLSNIKSPYYYEYFTSNVCNLMCRSCNKESSHLIAREAKKFNLYPVEKIKTSKANPTSIDIDLLTPDHRVYFHGGEPTIMPDVAEFLQSCIDKKITDFDLAFCTNGQYISKSFLDMINQFPKVNFSMSIDGYGKINDYWRHGSDWNTVIKNTKLLESYGHSIHFNTVPGIYNVTNLHYLYEFIDEEFPLSDIYLQINYVKTQSIYNHPIPELVIESMEKCKKTNAYYADGKSNKTTIDSIYDHYSSNPTFNKDDLAEFFRTNDKLDEIRGKYLKDYIPELEACRKFLD